MNLVELIFRARTTELEAAKQRLREVADATKSAEKATESFAKTTNDAESASKKSTDALSRVTDAHGKVADATKKSTSSTETFAGALDVLKNTEGPIGQIAQKFEALGLGLRNLIGTYRGLSQETTHHSAVTQQNNGHLANTATNLGLGGVAWKNYADKVKSAAEATKYATEATNAFNKVRDLRDSANKASSDFTKTYGKVSNTSTDPGMMALATEKARLNKIAGDYNLAMKGLGAEMSAANVEAAAVAVTSLGTALGVTAGLAATFYLALEGIGISARSAADDMDELAQKLGMTPEKLAVMTLLAKENGTSVESLQRTYDKLSKSMSKMDEDNERTAYSFEVLGLSMEDVAKMSEQQLAGVIIDNYEKLDRSTKATAAVQQLLGHSFRENIPAIKAAAAEFDDYQERIKKYGSVATPALVKAGQDQEKIFSDFKEAWKGLSNEIAMQTGTVIQSIVSMLATAMNSLRLLLADFTTKKNEAASIEAIPQARRNELLKQANDEVFNGSNPNATLGDANKRFKELLALEVQRTQQLQASNNFRKEEIRQGYEQAAIAELLKKSAAAVPPKKGGKEKEEKDPRLTYAEIFKLQEAERERNAHDQELIDQLLLKERDLFNARLAHYQELADPAKKFQDQLNQLNKDYETGAVSAEMYAATLKDIDEGLAKLKPKAKEASDEFKTMQAAGEAVFRGLEDALVGFATTGKFSFASFAKSVLADLARLFIQLTVTIPLMNSLKASMAGGSFFGTLIEAIGGRSATGAGGTAFVGPPAPSALGNVFHHGMLKSASGNVFDTPTLHGYGMNSIGMLGEAGPEAVLPLTRVNGKLGVQSSGGSGVQIGSIQIVVQGGNTNEETAARLRAEMLSTMKEVADGRIAEAQRPGGLIRR